MSWTTEKPAGQRDLHMADGKRDSIPLSVPGGDVDQRGPTINASMGANPTIIPNPMGVLW